METPREKENLLKRETRDIVFSEAFATEENLPLIYHALFPEDENWENLDYKILNISTVLINVIRNDLAFSAGDKVIFIEAQSTWKIEDLVRFGEYTLVVNVMWKNISANYHLAERENFVYVFFTGKNRNVKREYLALDGVRKKKINPLRSLLNFEIDVLSKENENIPEAEVFEMYLRFCEIFQETVKKYGRGREAVRKLIDTCIKEGIYVEFFKERREEVMENLLDMFGQLYHEEQLERKIEEAEQKLTASEQRTEEAEQKLRVSEQRTEEAEHRTQEVEKRNLVLTDEIRELRISNDEKQSLIKKLQLELAALKAERK